jgi:nucleoid DNA-binding protein|tara:strand:- start:4288 stop:4545 length:258 start_codon:yes stop_codon:yes gene_type:complete
MVFCIFALIKMSNLKQIIKEISYDLDMPEYRVKKILKETFVELGEQMKQGNQVMIKGYVKLVGAKRRIKQMEDENKYLNLETRRK